MIQLPCIIFRNDEGKILLQYRDSGAPTQPLKWSFFGGRTEQDRETVEQGIIREVFEELAMNISEENIRLLGDEIHTEESERHIYFFEYIQPITWKDIQVHEGAGAAFLSKEEILQMSDTTETAKYFVGKYA